MEPSSEGRIMNRIDVEKEIKQLISQSELADLLGVTAKTLYEWSSKGFRGLKLRKVKIGRRVFYRPADVASFQQAITDGQ